MAYRTRMEVLAELQIRGVVIDDPSELELVLLRLGVDPEESRVANLFGAILEWEKDKFGIVPSCGKGLFVDTPHPGSVQVLGFS